MAERIAEPAAIPLKTGCFFFFFLGNCHSLGALSWTLIQEMLDETWILDMLEHVIKEEERWYQGMSVFPLWQVQTTHSAWEHQQARVGVHWLIALPAWEQACALTLGKLK